MRCRFGPGVKLSRPPIERMFRLRSWLQAGKYPNCRSVAAEFEVAPKTIQRYYMRYQLGAEIGCDPVRFGYYYTKPVTHQGYCFAYDLDREQMRRFVLQRMRTVKLTRTKFERPEDFSIEQVLKGSFGVFSKTGEAGGKPHRIRIRFGARAARLVSESEWHESQEIINGQTARWIYLCN